MRFTGILSHEVPDYWPLVGHFIESGLGEGESLDDLYQEIVSRTAQLWVAHDDETIVAACVTELPTIGTRKVCNIRACGGTRMKEWAGFMPVIEAWALHNGCSAMRFPEVRKGWERVLTGFRVTRVTLEKELNHGV